MTKTNIIELERINGGSIEDKLQELWGAYIKVSIASMLSSGKSPEQIKKEIYEAYGKEPWVVKIVENCLGA